MYTEMLALSDEADKFKSKSYFGALVRTEAELGLGHDDLAKQAVQEALRRANGPDDVNFIKRRLRSVYGERADGILQ
jgi:hypothetical protein